MEFAAGLLAGLAGGIYLSLRFTSKVSGAIANLEATAKSGLAAIENALNKK